MNKYNFKKLAKSGILVRNDNFTRVLTGVYTANYRDVNEEKILEIINVQNQKVAEVIDVSKDVIFIDDVETSFVGAEELYVALDSLGVFFLDEDSGSGIQADDYATATVGGTLKVRIDGTDVYFTNDGTNP